MPLHPDDAILQPSDGPLQDYILEPYPDAGDRSAGLHSASVFRHFLRHHGLLDAGWAVVERCQRLLGIDRTVWGVKRMPDGRAAMELYFYNHGDRSRCAVGPLQSALGDVLDWDGTIDPDQPYLMCSLELDAAILRRATPATFRIYAPGTRQGQGYDGVSYRISGDRLILENHYWFLPANEIDQVRAHLQGSVHTGAAASQERLLDPALRDCFTICYAQKANADALYFSRIDTQRAAHWLAARWPGPVADVFAAESARLSHLRWDLGLDFSAPAHAADSPRVDKVGIYGFC